ncbi:protein of unknown function (plasmid) [Cupriavidus taiwanensis]|uniref:Uncharacterized protein n=1 Tax=Cupriavidus taiwanensis TaxID=164546 RepID=A0A375HC90_9BURK|nr:protein of unknown function [Cupriavidus taiwanensis]SOZ72491.1 protein of unknown function [Cupriavidus taiwanensis]SOZ74929.1 protein of unknown function [Cupriavidus taiwanensis]SPA03353.1 protein of unknown function [Cupriavidus taiwanensis]SPA11720.1 protein of unknown function [Cupriavidus taiwanensis]
MLLEAINAHGNLCEFAPSRTRMAFNRTLTSRDMTLTTGMALPDLTVQIKYMADIIDKTIRVRGTGGKGDPAGHRREGRCQPAGLHQGQGTDELAPGRYLQDGSGRHGGG